MAKGNNGGCVFPLTSLQIGDLQSYLSLLNLFLAPETNKFYILVDNRPWLEDFGSRSAHIWQLMVTKSRSSPFANTKSKKERKVRGELFEFNSSSKSNTRKSKQLERWFSLIDAATLSRKRALLRNSLISKSKLHGTLYGFIVFEVAWSDVRGINYLNELQTDTSLAIEAKCVKRWEFESIAQAANCISSWFPGTHYEQFLLKEHLDSVIGEVFYDAQEKFPKSNNDDDGNICIDNVCDEDESHCCLGNSIDLNIENRTTSTAHTPPPPDGPYKRRKVIKSFSAGDGVDIYSEETRRENFDSPTHSQTSYASDCEDAVEDTQYRDVLILFRFNDRDLPFKLREIIMSDLRLLTLLESGLPSWVIFLQSYPGFSHLYRPWMCPLARALYVMISFVTVLIGFYDLYKNVPVLKATASRLCGPLFAWIETWEMVSRIKYLGTMLFLHNFEKAITWFLMITRTIRSFLSILTQPMAGPLVEFMDFLLPFWNMCIQIVENLYSVFWIVIGSFFSLVENLVEIVLVPVWFIISVIWNTAMSVIYPMLWIVWEILYTPVRLLLGLVSLMAFIYTCIYDLLGDIWVFASSIFQFTSDAQAVSAYEVSMWRSLWNDLFSQVFRAVRSILNGFVAFFTACNRHRLSIYNHVQEFIQRLFHPARRLPSADSSYRTRKTQKLFEPRGREQTQQHMNPAKKER
ncbi:uncharacterized protein LOC132307404 [Cornus florida]|uniref:uncharacterized protein LOC132307404 n=1 Tax=Cornus florida TaxID=4283 RepID=UPI00289E7D7F|nr:uncharacterized protein LOC132307404 [Cornus florida]XP_059661128.1 uncharacterized protein LOC132307404 [Cornus florida]